MIKWTQNIEDILNETQIIQDATVARSCFQFNNNSKKKFNSRVKSASARVFLFCSKLSKKIDKIEKKNSEKNQVKIARIE